MFFVPNELKITINTGIPGYQKVDYKPYMSIPNLSYRENKVLFNPLIKIDKNAIDKIPENIRKNRFFNKSAFDSLKNYTKEATAPNLQYATENGYIDNNIQVILNTIFPENSVIYINKSPYVILDTQWTKGSWKMDEKQYANNKIHSGLNDENQNREKKFESLPPTIRYGPNYNGIKKILPSVPIMNSTQTTTLPTTLPTTVSSSSVPMPSPETSSVQKISPSTTLAPVPNPSPETTLAPVPTPAPETTSPANLPRDPEEMRKFNMEIDEFFKNRATKILKKDELKKDESLTPEIQLEVNIKHTQRLHNLNNFLNKLYPIANFIYKNMTIEEQQKIQNNLLKSTNSPKTPYPNPINLNANAYIQLINQTIIYKNTGGGNCFFIAVADAINYHNYNNPHDKIIYNGFGIGTKIFTQKYLRQLVLNYMFDEKNKDTIETYKQNALINQTELNNTFDAQVKAIVTNHGGVDLTNEQYINVAQTLYKNDDNFLINNVTEVPLDISDYYKPFTAMTDNQIKQYILSDNYWANEVAIYALCNSLGLNVIPIEEKNHKLKIPYANFDNTTLNGWSRYLFLYLNNSHYELMSFGFKEKSRILRRAIFKRDDTNLIVPIFIIFIIFGSYYLYKTKEFQNNFSFFPLIMQGFEKSYNKILNSPNKNYKNIFLQAFDANFPYRAVTTGGANNYYINNYYTNNRNRNYNHNYNQSYNDINSLNQVTAYYITIDMELHPGTTISPEEIKQVKCKHRWNSIKKAYSEFMGKPYSVTLLPKTIKNTNNNNNNHTHKKKMFKHTLTHKSYKPYHNYTRKYK